MATINIDNMIDNTTKFEFDFHFFKLIGNVEIDARNIFLAISEFEKKYRNIFTQILSAVNNDERAILKELTDKQDEVELMDFMQSIKAKYDLDEVRNYLEFGELILSGECKYLLLLINKLINGAVKNHTLETIFFNDDEIINYIPITQDEMTFINQQIVSDGSLSNILNAIASVYKKEYSTIYAKFVKSIIDFLENLK